MLKLSIDVLAQNVAFMKKNGEAAEAIELIEHSLPDEEGDVSRVLKKAELLYDLNETKRSWEIYQKLIASNIAEARYEYARRLYNRGFAKDAQVVLSGGELPLKKYKNYLVKVNKICDLLEALDGQPILPGTDTRIIAMKHAILFFRQRKLPPPSQGKLGRVALCTGSLGSGGAERQITRLAIELMRKFKAQGEVAGYVVDKPVDLIIQSLSAVAKKDFFLREVLDEDVNVTEIEKLVEELFDSASVESPELCLLLSHLPARCNYGVRHLAPHLLKSKPDCLSVWQDGACLMVSLAALIAGVPRIQLGLRGLPPVVRKHLFKPEYEPLYQALAQVPGVSFLSNNICVANIYAQWLNVEEERFQVVYNGVITPSTEARSDISKRTWHRFLNTTPDADITIGGVFRFVSDKSPFSWIDFAASYLQSRPRTRFVLVGDGELKAEAQKRAENLGILNRILFVGVARDVGYWMEKMDVFMLFSQFEGLPNVLVEAQMVGVPVVSTPAGGSAECILDGVSGYLLDDVHNIDFKQAGDYADRLLKLWRGGHPPRGKTQQFLYDRFSVNNMINTFVDSITLDPE